MQHHPPSHPPRSVLQLLIIALLLIAAAMLASAHATAQAPTYRLASSDLGVARGLVAPDTAVLSPDGAAAGPAAVEAYVDRLHAAHPEARFRISGVQVVSGLMIVNWQGTNDDTVVANGRTLITVDDGRIVRVTFVNVTDIAPRADAASTAAEPPSLYVIVNEQGDTVVAEAPSTVPAAGARG